MKVELRPSKPYASAMPDVVAYDADVFMTEPSTGTEFRIARVVAEPTIPNQTYWRVVIKSPDGSELAKSRFINDTSKTAAQQVLTALKDMTESKVEFWQTLNDIEFSIPEVAHA